MTTSFVHLHNHSEYSLLDGACKINKLVAAAAEQGMKAVALTDHGNLFGAIRFYDQAWREGVKPIIGCEVYLTPGSRFERGGSGAKDRLYHLTLLARTGEGYRHLLRLASQAYTEGFYYKPRVDKELLRQYSKGLFCLTGCLKGEIPSLLSQNAIERARKALEEYLEIFEPDSVYLELMENGLPEQRKVNQGLLELAGQVGVPVVATNDCHYIEPEDAEAHDILLCIQTGKTEDEPNRLRYRSREFYFKSAEQMARAFEQVPEAIANTRVIAEACNVEIQLKQQHRPEYFLPPEVGQTQAEYLRERVYAGARERFQGEPGDEERERLEYELSVIGKMGYESYFLIVWDFVRFARERGIAVGPGRGSAAGSLVSYCLRITDLNPLEHGLLFERFLNPERISMPDIDIDFSDKRRDEVIHYVAEKYGQESVAQIVTFGTMGAKMVVRDVGRALGYSAAECDRVAKMIPAELGTTIDSALKQSEELREWMSSDRKNARLIEIARRLEGLSRQSSTHAAGIVIAKGDLRDFTPLMKTNKGEIASQYDMKSVEKLGLIKMDFLGLRTLSILEDALGFLRQRGVELDLNALPLDDPQTYALLSEARTNGVFQLESSGMKDILKKLQPEVFSDLVAVLALYRPGPLGSGMVDDFIKRKHGHIRITYDHPTLEPILKETYGIILYQEQVMKIANAIAGFSLGEADLMRRAMGKKDRDLMERLQAQFINGAQERGVSKAVAEKLWRLINHFAGYGFNKSHSAAYAVISYQAAYLKAHYPVEFMASVLTNELGSTDKVVRFANDCRPLGIQLLGPCVNESEGTFSVRGNTIRFGLAAIKNVGSSAVKSILASRREEGPFKSLLDLCERVDLAAVNSKVLESLARAGAMDCFGRTRAELLALLPEAQERAMGAQRDRSAGQISLFEAVPAEAEDDLPHLGIEEMPEHEILGAEKQLLGVYLSGHPLSEHAEELALFSTASTVEVAERETLSGIRIAGVITEIRRKVTKTGEQMAIVTLEDLEGQVEVVVFPEMFRRNQGLLQEENILVVRGDGDRRGDRVSIKASQLWSLEQAREQLVSAVHLYLAAPGLEKDFLLSLKDRVAIHPGHARLVFHLKLSEDDEVVISAGEEYLVRPGPGFARSIGEVISDPALLYELNGQNGGSRRNAAGINPR